MLLLWHWFMHYSGADNGKWYPWWSGPGSDLGELTLLVAMVAYFRATQLSREGLLASWTSSVPSLHVVRQASPRCAVGWHHARAHPLIEGRRESR